MERLPLEQLNFKSLETFHTLDEPSGAITMDTGATFGIQNGHSIQAGITPTVTPTFDI